MATVNDTKNAIAAAAPRTTGLADLIEKSARELGRALPEHLRSERLVRIALTCIRLNPELSKCTPESFLGALFTSAQLGIEPIAGRAYLLPFNNSRKKTDGSWHTVKEVQFVLGYKGLSDLFYRHEKAVQLDWGVVHSNDEFDYELGTNAFLRHKPAKSNRGEPSFYWVQATLLNGGKPFLVMSKEDCLLHAQKHSKTWDKKKSEFYSSSPWATNTDAMCLKTVLIQLGKLLPVSVELQRAIEADETSRDFRRGIQNVLDLPPTTNWDVTDTKEIIDEPKKDEKGDALLEAEVETYVRLNIPVNDVMDYAGSLPFSNDPKAVAAHLEKLRKEKTPGELIAAIKRLPK